MRTDQLVSCSPAFLKTDHLDFFWNWILQFKDNYKIIVSKGEAYAGRLKDENSNQKKKEDAVVGLASSSLSEFPSTEATAEDSTKQAPSECTVRLIAKESLVEEEAVKQMNSTAQLPRMRLVVGLPDVHPGKGFPIGSASVSEDVFYPHLVGGDIGCGMSLFQTSIKTKKLKLDAWTDALHGLETQWGGNTASWIKSRGGEITPHDDHTLGTIGGGNHFAELQTVQEILQPEAWKELGLDEDQLFLLIHSGSRAYGESILRDHMDTFGPRGLLVESEEGRRYMENHNNALVWAKSNRSLIAHRFMSCLTDLPVNASCEDTIFDPTADGSKRVLDVWHNFVAKKTFTKAPNAADSEHKHGADGKDACCADKNEASSSAPSSQAPESAESSSASAPSSEAKGTLSKEYAVGQSLWLHRKGAAPADAGPVVIPGSRGHYSYLVMPSKDNSDLENAAYSLAHGAGRKWTRGKALQMGADNKKPATLTTTSLGSKVICENKSLLYEEVPSAYKEIENIIADLKTFNLITVVAIFKPLITYKTRAVNHDR